MNKTDKSRCDQCGLEMDQQYIDHGSNLCDECINLNSNKNIQESTEEPELFKNITSKNMGDILMKERIEIKSISFGSLFKLLFWGTFPVLLIFSLIVSIGVIFQGVPENPKPNQLYGWQALIAIPAFGIGWPFVFTLLSAPIVKLGLFILFRFKKSLVIEVAISKPVENITIDKQD